MHRRIDKKNMRILSHVFQTVLMVNLISLMATMIGTLIDGIIISRFLGETATGAFGLTNPLFNLLELIAGVIASGNSVLCGRKVGAGRLEEANRTFSASALLAVIISAVVALFMLFCSGAQLHFLGATGDVQLYDLAADYLHGFSLGIPALVLVSVFSPIMQLDSDKNRALLSVITLCVVNIAGDLVNVFFLHWGLFGMGVTTAISYYCALAVLVMHFFKKNAYLKPSLRGVHFRGLLDVLKNGVPTITNRSATMLRNYSFNNLALAIGGTVGLSAFTIVNGLSAFLSSLPKAVGSSTLLMSGVLYGEEDKDSLVKMIRISLIRALVLSVLAAAVLFFAWPYLMVIYTSRAAENYQMAVSGARWYSLCLIPYSLNMVYINYHHSGKHIVLSNVVSFMDGFGALFPVALVLTGWMDINGLWAAFFFGKLAVTVLIVVGTWIAKRKITFRLEDFLNLPETFDVPEADKLVATVTTTNEVIALSENAIAFYNAHGRSRRDSMLAGLCLEEMCTNIVNYGFNDGKEHEIDVRLLSREDGMVLRLRDNCAPFDPMKWLEIHHSEDPVSGVGIRLVDQMAKEFTYTSAMQLNNLLIRI